MVMNKYIPRINEYFIAAILLLLSKNRPNCAHSYNIDVLKNEHLGGTLNG